MISGFLNLALVIIVFLHILICPYTKVEESFNIQAIHDLIYHRTNISRYDHLEFPGVVPRSFIGPLIILVTAIPGINLLQYLQFPKSYLQILCRGVVGLLVCFSFIHFQNSVAFRTNPTISKLATLITLSQFHFLFYASRTLPNTFALIIVLASLASWLSNRNRRFIWFSALAIIIFRSELCIIFGLLLMVKLLNKEICFTELISQGFIVAVLALGGTVFIDSLFWQRYLWPEGEVLYYNTIMNKSSNWGTLPFLWYFYSAIPRVLLFFTVFLPIGFTYLTDRKILQLSIVSLIYVLIYSFLPHKELRFIVYVFPILNTVVAVAVFQLFRKFRNSGITERLFHMVTAGAFVGNICLTLLFTYVSHLNYPGGEAFSQLHILNKKEDFVSVHMCTSAAQTGVTRFGEINDLWSYSKDETINFPSDFLTGDIKYSHSIVEAPCPADSPDYIVQSVIHGFKRLKFSTVLPFIRVETVEKLCILKWTN